MRNINKITNIFNLYYSKKNYNRRKINNVKKQYKYRRF